MQRQLCSSLPTDDTAALIVGHPKQQPLYEPFILHASTDTEDAGLQLAEDSAALNALGPPRFGSLVGLLAGRRP